MTNEYEHVQKEDVMAYSIVITTLAEGLRKFMKETSNSAVSSLVEVGLRNLPNTIQTRYRCANLLNNFFLARSIAYY